MHIHPSIKVLTGQTTYSNVKKKKKRKGEDQNTNHIQPLFFTTIKMPYVIGYKL